MAIVYWIVFAGASFSSHCIGPVSTAVAQAKLAVKVAEFQALKKVDPKQPSGWVYGMSEPYIIAPPDPAYANMSATCKDH